MAHETKFTDGSTITSYLATAYAEEFCEGEDATLTDKVKAWSYLIGTKLAYQLQGRFGRVAASLIDTELIQKDGTVNWDNINDENTENL